MGSFSSPNKQKRTSAAGPSTSPTPLPPTIAGFTVLPITYSQSATHVLYARAHSAPKRQDPKGKQREELPEGRTLFIVNVPPDATERELIVLFKSCGTVERVVFSTGGASVTQNEQEDGAESEDQAGMGEDESGDEEGSGSEADGDTDSRPKKKRKIAQPEGPQVVPLPSVPLRTLRRTGHTAYVVFLDASSLARALKPPQKPYVWPIDSETPLGLAHYSTLYSSLRPPLDVVRAHADSWMEAFEHEQAKKRQESKYHKGEAIVDEDGFTLVTRGGAYGKTLGGGVGVASKQFVNQHGEGAGTGGGKRHRKKKTEKKEKEAFYAFQIHEKKRKAIIDLKKKFEEDKANIEKLKQSRKFKPY
ncbi:ribosomal RNA-processing protein 7-domain-containing protein [Cerioporus squamosus]|nr:ribosomal RNA-processing protein 7-domain-containing protein [Cerioporus squamosus]